MTDKLFSVFSSEKLRLKNRVVMAPMTRTYSPNNIPNELNVEYYRKRAAGGVGMIITEGTFVGHSAASGYENVPAFFGDEALLGWKKVVEAVHKEGGKIAPQLWHVGAIRKPGIEPGGELPGYSPSGFIAPNRKTGHAMSKQDINDVIKAFADAAKSAKDIGFDAIEIHGAHGYLIDQFFWSGTNIRDDEYGGDLIQRSRFAIELIRAVRSAVGEQFPIIFRWSQWKGQDYSAKLVESPEELKHFLTPLVNAGVDIFHCSQRRFWEAEFNNSELNLAGWVKKVTGKPVITVGSVGLDGDFLPENRNESFSSANTSDLDKLNQRLEKDEFDLVAVGRALIANADWVNKVEAGQSDQLVAFDKSALKNLI